MRRDVFSDRYRGDDVRLGLQDERWDAQPGQVLAVVRQEGRACEAASNLGVHAAETFGQRLREAGALRIAHDSRRRRLRPGEEIPVQHFKQATNVRAAESADVV